LQEGWICVNTISHIFFCTGFRVHIQMQQQAAHRWRERFPVGERGAQPALCPRVAECNGDDAGGPSMLPRDRARRDAHADAMAHHRAQAFKGLHADAHVERASGLCRQLFDIGLQRIAVGQGNEGLAQHIAEVERTPRGEAMACRQHHHQRVFGNDMTTQSIGGNGITDDAGLCLAGTDRAHDFIAGAFVQFHAQARALCQPWGQPRGQVVGQCRGVGVQVQRAARTVGERLQFAAQLRLLLQDQARVMGQCGTRFGEADAARVTGEQRRASVGFDGAQAFAGRSQCQIRLHRAGSDAAGFGHRQEQAQIGNVQTHVVCSARPCLRLVRRRRREDRIVRACGAGSNGGMNETTYFYGLLVVVFVLAGVVKGVTGMGLPTVAMGLLGGALSPVAAASMLFIPTFVTNAWQLLSGPSLGRTLRRLWPMMLAVVVVTLGSAALLVRVDRDASRAALGVALVVYALYALVAPVFRVPQRRERWLGPLVGAVSGVVTGATGVFVMPAVPYLQSLGLQREELVQALGLAFTVSTISLTTGLVLNGAFGVQQLGLSALAVLPALLGMWLGQVIRQRISARVFRACFLGFLLLLGLELMLRSWW